MNSTLFCFFCFCCFFFFRLGRGFCLFLVLFFFVGRKKWTRVCDSTLSGHMIPLIFLINCWSSVVASGCVATQFVQYPLFLLCRQSPKDPLGEPRVCTLLFIDAEYPQPNPISYFCISFFTQLPPPPPPTTQHSTPDKIVIEILDLKKK